jgi:hypothetical protein
MTYIAAPSGRSSVMLTTHHPAATRHRLYTFGDDERVANPGDLLIESRIGAGSEAEVLIVTYFRGREIAALAEVALVCVAEYDANSEWLSAPVSGGAA